jgi:hypothetical protein
MMGNSEAEMVAARHCIETHWLLVARMLKLSLVFILFLPDEIYPPD